MFDFRKVPVARILLPFAGGAVAGYELESAGFLYNTLFISALIWIALNLLFQWSAGFRRYSALAGMGFTILAFSLFLILGYGTGKAARPADPELAPGDLVVIRGEITREPSPAFNNWSLEMRLMLMAGNDHVRHIRTNLKVYLEIPEDGILPRVGEIWQLAGRFVPIRNSGNPGEPDYEAIMHRRDCWYRFYAQPWNPGHRIVEGVGKGRIRAGSVRKGISEHWSGDAEAVSLLKAVCLGDRTGLTSDMQQSYSVAGGMHLLAVSGLHVGLIWWVMNLSLSWMVRLFRSERYRAITIILLLWGYAFVTGFSSSVSRSVTMFTLFTIARMIDRRTHPLNAIMLSAFLLILVKPGRCLEVGFQLSYMAILGIVTLFPVFVRLWKVKNRILKWVWEACMVSAAAQLSTAPLVIHYFHQLPVYGLFTNLVAIPLLSLLVAIFVFSVPLMALGLFTGLFNRILVMLGHLMNHFMAFMSSLPGASTGELFLDRANLCAVMALVMLIMAASVHRSSLHRYLALVVITVLLGVNSWKYFMRMNTSELVVAHLSGCSLVTFREGLLVEHYCWYRNGASYGRVNQYISAAWNRRKFHHHIFQLGNTAWIQGGISGCMEIGPGLWRMGSDRIRGWVVKGPGVTANPVNLWDQPAGFILLSCEPRWGGDPLCRVDDPCNLIADGSNRAWFLTTVESQDNRIYLTGRRGAYVKRW